VAQVSRVPVWLLDLDGVVNAASRAFPTHAWPKETWQAIEAEDEEGITWPIKAARPVIDFLTEVHGEGRAEIRWHSTWQRYAVRVGRQLGLPDFGVQEAPEYQAFGAEDWWKLPAARRVLAEEGRDLLWTDDDADLYLQGDQRAELASLGGLLIVCPDSRTGLCKKHLRRIARFLGDPVGKGR
jgi:hypothetical protein